jgi:tungstate transport system substrate-binding protein
MTFRDVRTSRRKFIKAATAALAAGLAILAGAVNLQADSAPTATKAPQTIVVAPGVIRIASVSTAVEGDLLPILVESFQAETGIKTVLIKDDEPFQSAAKGEYDLVISHFGHRDVENFILNGTGKWPRTVFSNQLALVGPPSDPAHIRGVTSLVEAFRRIAHAKAPYVLNDTQGLKYLTDIIWNAAGKPPKGSWFIDPGVSKKNAIALAARKKAYVFWGLTPFLREQKARHHGLEPLVTADPMLQRIMVSIIVNPERVAGTNSAGAAKFQEYLLRPETQAKILGIHYPGVKGAVWAPAGRHNPGSALPE